MTRPFSFLIALSCCLLCCLPLGCSLAPKYARPEAPIPLDNYDPEQDALGEKVSLSNWQDFIRDPGLREVISLALAYNRDLRTAYLNVERSRAQYQIQRADLLPSIAASGTSDSTLTPAEFSRSFEHDINQQYTIGLGFSSYELDLFGRIRNLKDQALENWYSVAAEHKATQISVIAESAALYLQLVANREHLDLATKTAKSRQQELNLLRIRYQEGLSSDLEVSQAETLYQEAKSLQAESATQVEQAENALVLFIGAPLPHALPKAMRLQDVQSLPDIPAGLPSELLERRPDILSAEHLLKGTYANIGAARANFFPRISLTASFGTMSSDLYNLWSISKNTWSFVPMIHLPLFEGGRNKAQLEVAEVDRDIAVNRYEQTIQTAFREVRDALSQRKHISDQLKAQQALVVASRRSYQNASTRQRQGLSDYTSVLDAQRTLLSAQKSLINTKLLRETNALNMYKALGGGWDDTK